MPRLDGSPDVKPSLRAEAPTQAKLRLRKNWGCSSVLSRCCARARLPRTVSGSRGTQDRKLPHERGVLRAQPRERGK